MPVAKIARTTPRINFLGDNLSSSSVSVNGRIDVYLVKRMTNLTIVKIL